MKRSSVVVLAFLSCFLLAGCAGNKQGAAEQVVYEFEDVSVHDPSIIRYEDTYYIFGSHLAAAKSNDLINWESIGDGVSNSNPIIKNVFTEMKESFDWSNTKTFWAPDVIQLKSDNRFYMYYCTCEGSKPLSTLGIAVSDKIEGPYENLGIILKSGMTKESSENGDTYNAAYHPNAVDPSVFYDNTGRLFMMYGSYSGGIYCLELNTETGFPLEEGYGKKVLGANHLRIEAPYVLYNKDTKYYYMFLSFGGLDADGGYNIRVCRSENPDGPYYDVMGQNMMECKGLTAFDDAAASLYGNKLMGNYNWLSAEENESNDTYGYVSPGHNTAIFQEETGKYFITFHTRFENSGEFHQVRTHQMFFNSDGWPVVVPLRYTNETMESYQKKEAAGEYRWIDHGREITSEVKQARRLIFTKNGKIEGDASGTYILKDGNQMEMTIDNVNYKGIVIKAYDEYGQKEVMTFTVSGDNGVSFWGIQ